MGLGEGSWPWALLGSPWLPVLSDAASVPSLDGGERGRNGREGWGEYESVDRARASFLLFLGKGSGWWQEVSDRRGEAEVGERGSVVFGAGPGVNMSWCERAPDIPGAPRWPLWLKWSGREKLEDCINSGEERARGGKHAKREGLVG